MATKTVMDVVVIDILKITVAACYVELVDKKFVPSGENSARLLLL